MDDRWMTVKDVAEYLQLSRDQIYRLAQRGRIPASSRNEVEIQEREDR